jgi:hypothetical protein
MRNAFGEYPDSGSLAHPHIALPLIAAALEQVAEQNGR